MCVCVDIKMVERASVLIDISAAAVSYSKGKMKAIIMRRQCENGPFGRLQESPGRPTVSPDLLYLGVGGRNFRISVNPKSQHKNTLFKKFIVML